MDYHKVTKVADAVLAILATLYDDSDTVYSVECYQNGRESGWCINGKSARVAFSENRNSDAIVVYAGAYGDFDMAGNVPRGAAWENRRYFNQVAMYEAATYILGALKGGQL